MIKALLKKVLYAVPFLIAVLLVIGTFSGKTEKVIGKVLVKMDIKQQNKFDEKTNIVYKDGMIDLNKSFEFYIEPSEEFYDSNNKIAKSYAYGMTQDEYDFMQMYAKELIEYDNSHPLEGNQKGNLIFNKESVKKEGEEFDIKSKHLKGKVTNISVNYEISDDELKNFVPDCKGISEYLDENNKLVPMVIIKKSGSINNVIEERETMEVCYLTVDITYNSYSEWIQETDLCPDIIYLDEYDNRLEHMSFKEECGFYSESNMVSLGFNGNASFSPWFYDFETQKNAVCTSYPMFKGEEYTVRVGFVVPVEFLDIAYLRYSYTGMENTYNSDDILVKIKE